ncbi:MAG: hypothetical protein QMD88_08635 [Coprothermobacterota bacterium]|nr:hypothetical protein [Coprothermobacterota bacterium]
MRLKWRIVLILFLCAPLSLLASGISIAAQAYEIRDLSWIRIPDYSSPDLFPIEKTMQEIMINTKNEVADTPRNPQCLLMKWSDYIRYIDTGMVLPEHQLDDLIYVVTVDVIRRPWEIHSRGVGGIPDPENAFKNPALVEQFSSRQDIYIFDAKTGENLGFGYTPYVIVLPKH